MFLEAKNKNELMSCYGNRMRELLDTLKNPDDIGNISEDIISLYHELLAREVELDHD